MNYNMKNIQEDLVNVLSQIWTVTNCKCILRRSKSATHIECLQLDPWITEQLMDYSKLVFDSQLPMTTSTVETFADSMDSLQHYNEAVARRN